MRKSMIVLASILILPGCGSDDEAGEVGPPPQVQVADLKRLIGDDWTGELTYLNFSEPFDYVTIPAELDVTSAGRGVELHLQYPGEPAQDLKYTVEVLEDGRRLGNEPVMARVENRNGGVVIKTRTECEDLGRDAICDMTYTITDTSFVFAKMVTLTEDNDVTREDTFLRNEFRFKR